MQAKLCSCVPQLLGGVRVRLKKVKPGTCGGDSKYSTILSQQVRCAQVQKVIADNDTLASQCYGDLNSNSEDTADLIGPSGAVYRFVPRALFRMQRGSYS